MSVVARVVGLVLIIVALSCSTPRDAPRPANVLLITVDTLRPDALGWIGGRNQTPVIDRLAAEGFRFPAAVTHVPLTLPAHTSLLTGLIPPHHGIHDNGQTLGPEARSLAQQLRDRGYATAAFVSGFPLQAMFGLDRGFDRYDDSLPHGAEGWLERLAPETTAAALDWLADVEAPWFVWVHYYDPHDPYEPPRAFWQPGDRGAYDGEVAFTDHAIGQLMEGLPVSETHDIVTVVTSDHGEALGEHQEIRHGYFIYDSTMTVPLIFHAPGRLAPDESAAAARLVDVAPTLLDMLGFEVPDGVDGVSLLPILEGRSQRIPPAYIETRLPYTYFGWAPLEGLRDDEWKLIRAPRPELYRLSEDPHERVNVIAQFPARQRKFDAILDSLEQGAAVTAQVVDDPETIARLRALGYVGAGGSAAGSIPGELADPKDRIEQRNLLGQAEEALRAGRFTTAVTLYERVLEDDPRNRAATLRTGVAFLKAGQLDRAIERLERSVALDPERAEARFALGDALTRAGDLEAASQQWMELARLQPRRVEGWANLGSTLMLLGELERAVEAYEQAASLSSAPEHRRDVGQAYLALARREAAATPLTPGRSKPSKGPSDARRPLLQGWVRR